MAEVKWLPEIEVEEPLEDDQGQDISACLVRNDPAVNPFLSPMALVAITLRPSCCYVRLL